MVVPMSPVHIHSGIHLLHTQEEPWGFMGRDLVEVGGGVHTGLQINESLPEGRSNPEVNKVCITHTSLWL